MTTRYVQIPLSWIALHVQPQLIREASALRPGDESDPIIIDERLSIVDGYHRTAGMVRWAHALGDMRLGKVEITVIQSDDEDLIEAICLAAGNQRKQDRAIAALVDVARPIGEVAR